MREILLLHFYFSKTFHITWINLVYQNFLKNIQKQRRKGIASERVFIEGKTLFGKYYFPGQENTFLQRIFPKTNRNFHQNNGC